MLLSYKIQFGCFARYLCKFFSIGEAKPESFLPVTVHQRATRCCPGATGELGSRFLIFFLIRDTAEFDIEEEEAEVEEEVEEEEEETEVVGVELELEFENEVVMGFGDVWKIG
jgi:hypothetical protein